MHFFSVSLDPDDSGPILGHPGFERLKAFLSEEKWTGKILSDIAEWASKLPSLRPLNGVHYSLRNEGKNNSTVSISARFCLKFPFVILSQSRITPILISFDIPVM